MRGSHGKSRTLFSYVDLESRIPARHPLRTIRACHMWNGPAGKGEDRGIYPKETVRSYVRPFRAVTDRWPR